MLTGLAIGILAAFVWSITNLVDKYLVDTYAPTGNIGGVLLFSCFFPFFLMIVAAIMAPEAIAYLPPREVGLLLLSGGLIVIWIYFYLKALSIDDSSVVMTLLVLAPFFSLIFGQTILHEFLTTGQLLAGAFIVLGALTVTYEQRTEHFKWNLLSYAVAASAVTGLTNSVFKAVSLEAGTWESLFWRSSGMILVGCLLFLFVRRFRQDFFIFLREHFGQAIALNLSNESLTLVGDVFFAFAMIYAPLALIQTTEAYQPIFVFIMVLVLNRFGISAVTENTERKVLIQKGAGFFLVLGGTILLSVVT